MNKKIKLSQLVQDALHYQTLQAPTDDPRRNENSVSFTQVERAARYLDDAPPELLERIASDPWSLKLFGHMQREIERQKLISQAPAQGEMAGEILKTGRWTEHLAAQLRAHIERYLPDAVDAGESQIGIGEEEFWALFDDAGHLRLHWKNLPAEVEGPVEVSLDWDELPMTLARGEVRDGLLEIDEPLPLARSLRLPSQMLKLHRVTA